MDETARIVVPSPPPLPEHQGNPGLWMSALPMVASAAGIAIFAGMSGAMRTRGLIAGGVFLLAAVAFVAVQFDRHRRERHTAIRRSREEYLRQLATTRAEARRARAQQRADHLRVHPPPSALAAVIAAYGPAWHADAPIRTGTRPVALHPPLVADDDPAADPDRYAQACADRLVAAHSSVAGPRLRDTGPIYVRSLAAARSALLSAAHTRDPGEWAIAVVSKSVGEWDWVKWLPHATSHVTTDRGGGRRLVAGSPAEIQQMRDERPAIVVTPHAQWAAEGDLALVIDPTADPGDECDRDTAEAVARQLAAYARTHRTDDFFTLINRDPHDLVPAEALPSDPLCVPIGVCGSQPVRLDLKEASLGGMGPHGLIIGATGSGKSELLRTIVLGLAITHPVEHLNLVLIDFKGGATFAGLADLPHTSALITNLEGELTLADRMADALVGELTRRQELLRRGNVASIHEYAQRRQQFPQMAPLASLVIVVDEFSELLSARPEFTELFVMIGRLGRSLGLHLLLASQRLDEGRLQGLESHLSYRVALRTFSAMESRVVLGVTDAYELPLQPGAGLLQGGPEELVRFQATCVSGAVPGVSSAAKAVPWTVQHLPTAEPTPESTSNVLDHVVHAHRDAPGQAHQVWLPPLTEPETLDYCTAHSAGLRIAMGVVDLPRLQRRAPLALDLNQSGGHLAVAGAPRSGVSTAITTIAAVLALQHAPIDMQFVVIDEPGGLRTLEQWPHCAAYAARNDDDLLRRIIQEVTDVIRHRQSGAANDRGHLFVLIDGWEQTRMAHPDLEDLVRTVAAQGLAVGVHLMLGVGRWAELRMGLREAIGTRVELRMGDPLDSDIDRRKAAAVPDRPGHGLTTGGHQFLVARPECARSSVRARLQEMWPTRCPQITTLPHDVRLASLPTSQGARLALGERTGNSVTWHPDEDPHLLIFGAAGAGKTTLLHTVLTEIQRSYRPDEAQVALLDPRRRLSGVLDPAYALGAGLDELATHLRSARAADQWEGPDIFVVVDDYEIATAAANPLLALQPLLAQALDIGLRLVVARGSAGAARAIYEPMLQSIRDLAGPGLLLSGAKDEGPLLHGVTPRQLPPGRALWLTRSRQEYVQIARG